MMEAAFEPSGQLVIESTNKWDAFPMIAWAREHQRIVRDGDVKFVFASSQPWALNAREVLDSAINDCCTPCPVEPVEPVIQLDKATIEEPVIKEAEEENLQTEFPTDDAAPSDAPAIPAPKCIGCGDACTCTTAGGVNYVEPKAPVVTPEVDTPVVLPEETSDDEDEASEQNVKLRKDGTPRKKRRTKAEVEAEKKAKRDAENPPIEPIDPEIKARENQIEIKRQEKLAILEAIGVPVEKGTRTDVLDIMIEDAQRKINLGLHPITGEPMTNEDVGYRTKGAKKYPFTTGLITTQDIFDALSELQTACGGSQDLLIKLLMRDVGTTQISTELDQGQRDKLHLALWSLLQEEDPSRALELDLSRPEGIV